MNAWFSFSIFKKQQVNKMFCAVQNLTSYQRHVVLVSLNFPEHMMLGSTLCLSNSCSIAWMLLVGNSAAWPKTGADCRQLHWPLESLSLLSWPHDCPDPELWLRDQGAQCSLWRIWTMPTYDCQSNLKAVEIRSSANASAGVKSQESHCWGKKKTVCKIQHGVAHLEVSSAANKPVWFDSWVVCWPDGSLLACLALMVEAGSDKLCCLTSGNNTGHLPSF